MSYNNYMLAFSLVTLLLTVESHDITFLRRKEMIYQLPSHMQAFLFAYLCHSSL